MKFCHYITPFGTGGCFSIEVLFVVKWDTEAQRRSITQILCWCKLEITSPGVILGKTATFL